MMDGTLMTEGVARGHQCIQKVNGGFEDTRLRGLTDLDYGRL